MDSSTLYCSLDIIAVSGHSLKPEHKTSLHSSLVTLKKNYKFKRVLFWGKILGLNEDYYIAQGRGEDELKDRVYVYSFNCMDWLQLPPATDLLISQVTKVAKGPFKGDPSFVYEHEDLQRQGAENQEDEEDEVDEEDEAEEVEEKEEKEKATKVTEEMRLAVVVHQIDNEVSVVPRGAFVKRPHGLVELNRSFGGLSESEAKELENFLHFSDPKNIKEKSVQELGELNPAIDFLDALSEDIPEGSWSLQLECNSRVCVLRSLLWLGLTFYHVPMTQQHGYGYIGYGYKNFDLQSML